MIKTFFDDFMRGLHYLRTFDSSDLDYIL